MSALPFRSDSSVPLPSALRAYENGKFPGEVLVPCGIRNFVMAEPAASAMRAMVAAAAGDGITISATGTWRSYDDQKRLFESRYVTHDTGGDKKVWNGTTYWKLPKVASAATPGTSNHGKGLAADLSNSPKVPISGATLKWVAEQGPKFGFWNTVRSEAWHWSYCLGDDAPDGVTPARPKRGALLSPTLAPSVDWAVIAAMDAKLSAIPFSGELTQGAKGEAVTAIQWKLVSFGHDVAASGDFDAQTVDAVKSFQRAQRLADDGRVGKQTWGALGLPGAGDRPPPPPTEAPPEPEVQAPTAPVIDAVATTYEVQAGDGFVRIARRTLWSSSLDDATAIAAFNGLTLESLIVPGQMLQIPSCHCTGVGVGDDWVAIAQRLGVDPDALREANTWQGDVLTPGMLIYGGRAPA